MEVLIENIIIYSIVAILFVVFTYFYLRKQKRNSKIVEEKTNLQSGSEFGGDFKIKNN